MKSDPALIAQIDDLFHPRSIAVVGAPRGMKTGAVFLTALLEQGFPRPDLPGDRAEEISGLKTYPGLAAIPGPWIWPLYSCLTRILWRSSGSVPPRGVKGAVLFTAGYTETGTAEGKALEEELVRLARRAGMRRRLSAPTGWASIVRKQGFHFSPGFPRKPGRSESFPTAAP